MDEYLYGTESEQPAEESGQHEFCHRLRQQKEKQAERRVLLKTILSSRTRTESLSDEEWLLVYINEQQEIRRLEKEFKKRLENGVRVGVHRQLVLSSFI